MSTPLNRGNLTNQVQLADGSDESVESSMCNALFAARSCDSSQVNPKFKKPLTA